VKNHLKNEQLTIPNGQWREARGCEVFAFLRQDKFLDINN
jgi:hypothetical protein